MKALPPHTPTLKTILLEGDRLVGVFRYSSWVRVSFPFKEIEIDDANIKQL